MYNHSRVHDVHVGDTSRSIEYTQSLCPECLRKIDAEVFEDRGEVRIRKRCPEHGEMEDIYWSDADLYRKFMRFNTEGGGVSNPLTERNLGCPYDCGLCPNHKSTTILANIDVTNRCNQHCPVCFANAAEQGYIYEPTKKQIEKMMRTLRAERPVPCPVIQFSGGEPTLRDDLPELIRMAKDFGFSQIQIATNGVKLSIEYIKTLERAGLSTIYLQFDGLRNETYMKTRGYNALQRKLEVIENCRAAGMDSVVLVQTLVKGVNDDQVGDLIRFAAKNHDVVKAVNVQPVSFTGRIDRSGLRSMRITIPDFIEIVEEQTGGQINKDDFYPVSCVWPISHLVGAWKGSTVPNPSCHPACGAATFIFVDGDDLIPLTRFVDLEGVFKLALESADDVSREGFVGKAKSIAKFSKEFVRLIDVKKVPRSGMIPTLILNIFRHGNREALAEFFQNTLFIGGMHFQDLYNIDCSRLEKCVIHYATPDGRIIPFCTYNSIHREGVEKKFSKPYDKHGNKNS